MWPNKFCPACGNKFSFEKKGIHYQQCQFCHSVYYNNAKPCAGVLIIRDNKVLLAKRARPPREGTWDVVGGFLKPDEHPIEAAIRETKEETGLDVYITELLDIFVDTYGHQELYTLTIYYIAEAPHGEPEAADDVRALQWFDLDSPPENLAFSHQRALMSSLKLLQHKGLKSV